MPVKEAVLGETPYGRYVRSDGWFVLNLADALAVRNAEKGGAVYPLEGSWEPRFIDFGVNVRVLWPHEPNALYHAEGAQEGFFVLSGECTLIVEDEERPLRQWDYFHCPADTRHVLVGAGDGPCAILAIGARPEGKTVCFPVSDVAAAYGASAAKETDEPDEAYADWPGEYQPVRLPWPLTPTRRPDGPAIPAGASVTTELSLDGRPRRAYCVDTTQTTHASAATGLWASRSGDSRVRSTAGLTTQNDDEV